MGRLHTHYSNLKVMNDAPIEVIRSSYLALSKKYHPDLNPNRSEATRIMQILNTSYEILSDATKRKLHDEWIRQNEFKAEQPQNNSKASTKTQPDEDIKEDFSYKKINIWEDVQLILLKFLSFLLNNPRIALPLAIGLLFLYLIALTVRLEK